MLAQVWLVCVCTSGVVVVGGLMAKKTVAVMSLQQHQSPCSKSLPRHSLPCQHQLCIPISCMQETANVTTSHHISWDMSSINFFKLCQVRMKADTALYSAESIISVYIMNCEGKRYIVWD